MIARKTKQRKTRVSRKPNKLDAARKILEAKIALEAAKEFYKDLDDGVAVLLELGVDEVGILRKTDGRRYTVRVVDNFAEKNTVFRTAGVSRFSAEVSADEEA